MDNIDDTATDRFMEHTGHSKSIDRNVYAVPPILLELIGGSKSLIDEYVVVKNANSGISTDEDNDDVEVKVNL